MASMSVARKPTLVLGGCPDSVPHPPRKGDEIVKRSLLMALAVSFLIATLAIETAEAELLPIWFKKATPNEVDGDPEIPHATQRVPSSGVVPEAAARQLVSESVAAASRAGWFDHALRLWTFWRYGWIVK